MMNARRLHSLGAAALLLAAVGLAWQGQPTPEQKWQFMASELAPRLSERQVQIESAELLGLMHNDYVELLLIDLRHERDWNLFHLWGAERVAPDELLAHKQRFAQLPENGVIVFMSNDEAIATQAWKKTMAAASRPNAYILAGGINRWLDEFSADHQGEKQGDTAAPDESLRHHIRWALGSRHPASLPDPHHKETPEFAGKVKLQKRVVKKGGCG